MTYDAIVRFAIDGGITDEEALTAALMQAAWDFETTVTAKAHFATYLGKREEAEHIKAEAVAFVAAFDAETAGQFEAGDEAGQRARRKAFATRLLGPEASPEMRAMSGYCFLAFDGRMPKLDATLLRRVILGGKGGE